MTAIQLTNEILDEWLGVVERESGAPAGFSTAPEPADISTLPDGRSVPPELRTLWSWRTIPYRAPETGVAVRPMSIRESFEISKAIWGQHEELVRDCGPGGWTENWSEDYLIWSAVDRIWLVVDLTELGPTSPVYVSGDADLTERPGRIADSLGELFEHWTALIETGHDVYDDGWTYTQSKPARPEYPIDGSPR